MFEGPTMSTPHAYLYAGWGADPQPWESLAGWRVASKRLDAGEPYTVRFLYQDTFQSMKTVLKSGAVLDTDLTQ